MTYGQLYEMGKKELETAGVGKLRWMPDCFWNSSAVRSGMTCWPMETVR